MKKVILFFAMVLLVGGLIFYFLYGKELISKLDDNKTYEIKNQEIVEINMFDVCEVFNQGLITYNNQKIEYRDYNNVVLWQNENKIFSNNVYIGKKYIYKCLENSIEIIDKNNKSCVVTEIQGKIINVSRENNKTYIITKQNNGQNSLYMLNDHNEVIVDNKYYNDIITGISISDKSEGYCLNTLKYYDGVLINNLSYSLLDNMELWNKTFKNEIIMKIKVINNNVLLIGTENIYFFNANGSLMWKNSNYSKIKDYKISIKDQKIYILFEKDEKAELLVYNFEGKVKEIYKLPKDTSKFRILYNKIYIYNENMISLFHDNKLDKLFEENSTSIIDFNVDNSSIYILLKDKLVKGQIK